MQEGAITRASDHLNDARQKLFDTHVHQKEMTAELERLEGALNAAEDPVQQTDLQDRIKHIKSDIEVAGNVEQQQQTTEIQAELQLREEQDKMNALESQIDELITTLGNSVEPSAGKRK
jgi:chromosome segregation ATPase